MIQKKINISRPDMAKQHEKTPAKRRRAITGVDEETGETFTQGYVWDDWVEGIGEDSKILKINDVLSRIPEQATPVGLYTKLWEDISGAPFDTSEYPYSAKGVLTALLELYGDKVNPDYYTVAELRARYVKTLKLRGRWGLGCPNNCGRFWEFKPNESLDGIEPSDPVAREYLKWKIVGTSASFICDKCGTLIEMSP